MRRSCRASSRHQADRVRGPVGSPSAPCPRTCRPASCASYADEAASPGRAGQGGDRPLLPRSRRLRRLRPADRGPGAVSTAAGGRRQRAHHLRAQHRPHRQRRPRRACSSTRHRSSNLTALAPADLGASSQPAADYLLPYLLMFILYLALAMTSGFMLQSVSREKENRTAEMLLVSLSPRRLMLGKIAGLSAGRPAAGGHLVGGLLRRAERERRLSRHRRPSERPAGCARDPLDRRLLPARLPDVRVDLRHARRAHAHRARREPLRLHRHRPAGHPPALQQRHLGHPQRPRSPPRSASFR